MQIIPVLPRQNVGRDDKLENSVPAVVKQVNAVEERASAFPLSSHYSAPETPDRELQSGDKSQGVDRRESVVNEGRRLVCRRFQHQQILEELRSTIDRRKHRRRKTDLPSHIDVKV